MALECRAAGLGVKGEERRNSALFSTLFNFRPWLRRTALVALLAGVSLAAAGCASMTDENDPATGIEDVANRDLSPRRPSGGGFFSVFGNGGQQTAFVQQGEGQPLTSTVNPPRVSGNRSGENFEVSLEGADIATAASTIFGDVLRVGYSVDPRVQGTVTVVTAKPVPESELIVMFETALRGNNVALIREAETYRIVPAEEAVGNALMDSGGTASVQPGYGVSTVVLRNVSAATIVPIVENFVARQDMIRADNSRNVILVQGTANERRAAIAAIQTFDQDWLAQQSVGIFPLESASAPSMVTELTRILDLGDGGRGRGMVRVQPLAKMNAVLVVARSNQLLQRTASWIKRIDRGEGSNTNLKVYRVQHVEARQLAQMVNSLLTGGGGTSGSLDNADLQLPPGSRPTVSTTGGNDRSQPTGPGGSGNNSSLGGSLSNPESISGDIDPNSITPGNSSSNQAPSTPDPTGRGGSGGSLLPSVRITANTENNSLLIYADRKDMRIVEQAIAALDRPSEQVAIEATIAEVTLNNNLKYGVQFFLTSGDLGLGKGKGSGGLFNSGTNEVLKRVLPGFNLLLGPENEPRMILDALRAVTDVKIISTPSVVVRDNRIANLQVGDEVPITTRQVQGITDPNAPIINNVEFRKTGVILRVRPRVTAGGIVNLEIAQEISSVANERPSLTPTIAQRKVESSVSVASGQTVLLGGLVSERGERGREGIPVLGDVPFVGDLFRSNLNKGSRTELIVLIRPQIIRDGHDAARIAEEMRGQLILMNGKASPRLRKPLPTTIQ